MLCGCVGRSHDVHAYDHASAQAHTPSRLRSAREYLNRTSVAPPAKTAIVPIVGWREVTATANRIRSAAMFRGDVILRVLRVEVVVVRLLSIRVGVVVVHTGRTCGLAPLCDETVIFALRGAALSSFPHDTKRLHRQTERGVQSVLLCLIARVLAVILCLSRAPPSRSATHLARGRDASGKREGRERREGFGGCTLRVCLGVAPSPFGSRTLRVWVSHSPRLGVAHSAFGSRTLFIWESHTPHLGVAHSGLGVAHCALGSGAGCRRRGLPGCGRRGVPACRRRQSVRRRRRRPFATAATGERVAGPVGGGGIRPVGGWRLPHAFCV
jgi:hypothetical protein